MAVRVKPQLVERTCLVGSDETLVDSKGNGLYKSRMDSEFFFLVCCTEKNLLMEVIMWKQRIFSTRQKL